MKVPRQRHRELGEMPNILRGGISSEEEAQRVMNALPKLEDVEAMGRRFGKQLGRVNVPPLSQSTHHAIERVLDVEAGRRKKRDEALAQTAGLPPAFRLQFGIDLDENARLSALEDRFTTERSLRRLALLNAIFLALQRVKGSVRLKHDEAEPILMWLRRASISFHVDRVEDPASPAALEIRCDDQTWRDQQGRSLEQQLTEIVTALAMAAERNLRFQAAHQVEVWRKLAPLRAAELARAKIEGATQEDKKWIAALRQEVAEHNEAERIRAYVAAAAATTKRRGDFDEWSARALAYADRLDPLTR